MHLADIMIDVFSAESAVLRAQRRSRGARPRAALHADAARVFVNDAALRIEASARQALAAMAEGDTLRTMLAALRRLLKVDAGQHRRAAAAPRGRSRRARRLSVLLTVDRDRLVVLARGCVVADPALRRAVAARVQQAAGRPQDYAAKIAADRAAKDAAFRHGDDPIPEGAGTPSSCRSPTSRSIRTTTCRRRSSRATIRRSSRCRRRPAPTRKMRRVGTLEFTLKGQPLKLTAFVEVGADPEPPVRAVQRSDQRHRDLRRPAGSSISTATRPASTRSTSTAPTSRTATTTRPTSARIRRRRTG